MAKYNSGFKYNDGHIYNTTILYVTIGGSVSPTSTIGHMASFKRNITALINSTGIFSRTVPYKRSTGDASVSITAIFCKNLARYIERIVAATSSLSRRNNKPITSTLNSDGFIERRSQFYRAMVGSVAATKDLLKFFQKNLYGSLTPTAHLERMSAFYRNIAAGVVVTGNNVKQLCRNISRFITSIGTATKTMSINTFAVANILGLLRLSTSKNMHDTIDATGHFSRIGTFYRTFSGTTTFTYTTSKTVLFVRNVGNNFISLAGKIAKTIRKSISGIVVISRDVMNFVGNGAVHILSTLSFYKYYFLVTLDNILLPLGVKVRRESDIDSMPSVKENTAIIPGKHGEVNFGTKVGKRLLEFRVATDEMEPEEKRRYKRLIAKHFKGDTHRNLVFEDDTNKVYAVKFSGKIDPEQYPRWLDLAIPFKAASPFIESTYEKTHIGSGTALNEGTCETPLFIKITGETADPKITIGDITLGYTGTIPAGKTLVIDTEKLTAELDGENVLDDLTGDITVMLQPGETTVTADSNVTFIWRERWV